ncbi:hypothetical protein ACP275_13G084700 [Erythranthe tilingii]
MVSIDRLSDLPDSLLTHILSLIPTKFSVRTSILARRWRFLWAEVPTLHFQWEDHHFIDRVHSLHKAQTITAFRIISNEYYFDPIFKSNMWIAAAVNRNVKIMDICFSANRLFLHTHLFTCKTLVDLRLNCCGVIPNMDGAIFLPCLKILHLIHLRHQGGGETHAPLLPGCPVLEELVIGFIADQRCTSCTISSPTIQRLTIHFQFVTSIALNDWAPEFEDDLFFGMFRRLVYNHGYKVDVNTPALRYLHFDDRLSELIVFGELASLIEADIYLRNDNKKRDDVLYSRFVLELFDRLCNVELLKLDLSYCTEIVDSVFSSWNLSFGNLTKLELAVDCRFLSKFLEYADC